MSSLRRLTLSNIKHWRPRAGGESKGFFTPGTQDRAAGRLFNETPPPPGYKRKWESWEAPWYTAMALTVVILGVGLPARPDSRQTTWARKEAIKELKAEGQL
ncbi:hypothetical protein WJX73_006175 [Symbiochloris irregularis]|uniref:NADH dehydrogenase [ubiquinone] 1 beta subcomplex subunit 11, mitochondrial n=1 Tax=Symbiochloris irregularis TaxID=706552 RepID=A0AAW1PC65_9CHLO